jgi:hypothetical protein
LIHEKLKRVSDEIYIEAGLPEDGKNPKWRRRFQFVTIPLKQIKVITGCTVNKVSHVVDSSNPLSQSVEPDISGELRISAIADYEVMKDRIYIVDIKEGEETFSPSPSGNEIIVTITAGEPFEGEEVKSEITPGVYWGNAFKMQDEDGVEKLFFHATIPKEHMSLLVDAVRLDPKASVELNVWLSAFSFEVDDFLRERGEPRDLIINDMTVCFVSIINVTSNIGNDTIPVETKAHNQPSERPAADSIASLTKPLNSLVTATWVLVGVIAYVLIFK